MKKSHKKNEKEWLEVRREPEKCLVPKAQAEEENSEEL